MNITKKKISKTSSVKLARGCASHIMARFWVLQGKEQLDFAGAVRHQDIFRITITSYEGRGVKNGSQWTYEEVNGGGKKDGLEAAK